MELILRICLVVICMWSVGGHPAKLSESATNRLKEKDYELKEIVFSPDISSNIFGSRFGQLLPETDWTYQVVDSSDRWNERQKRAVRKPSTSRDGKVKGNAAGKGNSRRGGTVGGKGPERRRESELNGPNTLPERQKNENFKQSLRHILILGNKQSDKTGTIKTKGKPSGNRQTPKRSNKGSFSIVPAKPKPKPRRRFPLRRGWRSRLRSRERARARARSGSQKPKPKRVIRKTVRRGFVVLD
ncbi:uncharacterized protein LOC117337116 [Pecten maximus]|uniref:uncharacterized protein LOC117337116 n=1 Tax=Pecten maximus TaxID=6579 RepID=UPI001458FA97|nr:uncharacterized protein LOC117337116 [Pecten maximus]